MTDHSHRFRDLETNLVHAGAPRPPIEGAVTTPIFQSANYYMGDASDPDAVRYIRLHNSPNHHALQARLAAIENGEAALALASGMAAISSTMLAFLESGDHLLVQQAIYGGTQDFLDHDLPRLGIGYTAVDAANPSSWEAALRPSTKMFYVEAISNPLLSLADLDAVVAFARQHGLVPVIDSTFATPVNLKPLEIGFDLVVHSATKYLNGHSDIVAGVVIGAAVHIDRIRQMQLHFGSALDPHACFLLERGLKTLALRVERQNRTALELARFLDRHPAVTKVHYPGLEDHPQHHLARRYLKGYGGMLAFHTGDAARTERFLSSVQVPLHAVSLGGVETLVIQPTRSSHTGMEQEEREHWGITDDLVRVSVGIESAEELIDDFGRALGGA